MCKNKCHKLPRKFYFPILAVHLIIIFAIVPKMEGFSQKILELYDADENKTFRLQLNDEQYNRVVAGGKTLDI